MSRDAVAEMVESGEVALLNELLMEYLEAETDV
jgi:hypothetical protein